MLKQMSTEDIDIKKRKRWCDNSDSNRKKRNRRQSNRIYQIKAVAISPGYYHYFGRNYKCIHEQRLETDWMNKNNLGPRWRKHHLLGQKKKKLGTWVRFPIGASAAGKLFLLKP
jgi:hypothetical protein